MEERRRGCSVAAETPPPLLGLVAFAVLHHRDAVPLPRSSKGVPRVTSNDELEWLNKIEMATSRTRSLIWKLHKFRREQLTGLMMLLELPISFRYNDLMLIIFSKHPDLFPEEFEHFDDFTIASSWERFISKIEAICRLWMADGPNNLLDAGFNRNHSSEVSSPVAGYLPGYMNYQVGMSPQIPVERKWALGLYVQCYT
ncbi:hypothetical protein HN51_004821 [Arachis hypogaea]